jgi:predicted PurR-regulated permease PerM
MSSETRQMMIRDSRIIITLLSIITVMGMGAVVYQARGIFLPFLLAVFISYILNPLFTFLEKRRVPVAISILVAVLITFLMLGLLGFLINTSIKAFAAEFPRYERRLDLLLQNLSSILNLPPELFSGQLQDADRNQLLAALDNLSLTGIITTTLGSVMKFLSNTVLVLLFLLFILMGRNQLRKKLELAFNPGQSQKLVSIYTNINRQVQKYIIAKTFISLITAVLVSIILYSFGVEFAMIWGILTFLLNFIPSIGSVMATILPISIAFIQFESYLTILLVAVLLIVIQFTMGNLIDPRVVGNSVNLSPLVVLFSLIFWGWMLGIVGMFLAVPLSVVLKIVFENISDLRFLSVLMSAHK